MKRRSFLKAGLLGLAASVAPLAWSMGLESFPDYDETGRPLRRIFRLNGYVFPNSRNLTWKRIRLKDARPGDILRMEDNQSVLDRMRRSGEYTQSEWYGAYALVLTTPTYRVVDYGYEWRHDRKPVWAVEGKCFYSLELALKAKGLA